MASSYPKQGLLLFLIVLFSTEQINARQSNFFFSKFVHTNNNDSKNPKIDPFPEMPSPAPAPAPAPEVVDFVSVPVPSLTPSSTENSDQNMFYAHGLKHDQYLSSPKKIPTTTMGGENDQIVNEKLSAESFENGYVENNKPTNYYYNNGYVTNYNDNSYTNYPNSDNFKRDNGYDAKNEDINDQFDESVRGGSREDQGYYFGNNEKHEFDTMEEYHRYQKSHKLTYWP